MVLYQHAQAGQAAGKALWDTATGDMPRAQLHPVHVDGERVLGAVGFWTASCPLTNAQAGPEGENLKLPTAGLPGNGT